jgi:hypothetical protein
MKRRKRSIWWESGVAGHPRATRNRVPDYDEWARQHVGGFVPRQADLPWSAPRVAGPVPERLQTLGEALTHALAGYGHSVPEAAAAVGTSAETFVDWALDRSDPGATADRAVMAYLGVDYYTLRGLTLRSQMRRVQSRIHRLPA